MRILDPHIHCYSRTTTDYEMMRLAGIEAVIEPAFWLGSSRTHAATFFDYFEHMATYEPTRAKKYGIRHFSCVAMNPKESEDRKLSAEVIAGLPRYLDKPTVVAVGEVGFNNITANEEWALRRQFEVAEERKMLVLVHTPHVEKARGTERTLKIIQEMKLTEERILIDHNDETTIAMTLSTRCWAGHTIYPFTKLSPERFAAIVAKHGTDRMLANSAADWGPSDPLAVPKTIQVLRHRGFAEDLIRKIVWENPIAFFEKSGRLSLPETPPAPDAPEGLARWVTHHF